MTRRPFFVVLLSAGGVSVVSQAVALLRQVLIVSTFGFSRELDFYATVYALASASVFSLAVIIDSVYIGLLGEIRAGGGDDAVRRALRSYMSSSLVITVGVSAIATISFPILMIPFAAGFSGAEKSEIQVIAVYFIPWALLVVPYYALGACMKSTWRYRQFFIAELVVTLASTLAILLCHENVGDIALAFACGYGLAVLYLAAILSRNSCQGNSVRFPWRAFASRVTRHFTSNQVGTLNTLAERFWFSFLPAGGIAALALVQQLTMNLSGLLSFRDAYLVPLADASGRPQKLARLLSGFFILAVAAAALVVATAEPICATLFQYGKVATEDVTLVARLLSISMLGLVMSVLATPVWRMLQVGGDYRPLTVAHFLAAISTMALGATLTGWLDLGATGMALIAVINAAGLCLAALRLAHRAGARVDSSVRGLLIRACFFFGGAAFAAHVAAGIDAMPLVRLAAGGTVYGILLLLFAALHRRELMAILKGGT